VICLTQPAITGISPTHHRTLHHEGRLVGFHARWSISFWYVMLLKGMKVTADGSSGVKNDA
jgi:hypothetical protein